MPYYQYHNFRRRRPSFYAISLYQNAAVFLVGQRDILVAFSQGRKAPKMWPGLAHANGCGNITCPISFRRSAEEGCKSIICMMLMMSTSISLFTQVTSRDGHA